MAEEQIDYEDEEYGGAQKLQYQGSGAIPALADDELMGEDDDFDDLYNDVNVGEGFLQLHRSEAPLPPGGVGNGGLQTQKTDVPEQRVESAGAQEMGIPGVSVEGKYSNAGVHYPEQKEGSSAVKAPEMGSSSYPDGSSVSHRGRVVEMTHDPQFRNMGFQGSTSVPPNSGVDPSDMPGKIPNEPMPVLNSATGGPRGAQQMPSNQINVNTNVNHPIINESQIRPPVENGQTMLFVGELHWWTTDAELEGILSQYGRVKHRDHVSWASILTAHNQANLPHLALSMFPSMLKDDELGPDHFVLASLVKACTALGAIRKGKQVHAHFVLSSFRDDNVVKSSLVDMYAKCGLLDNARGVFDSISSKNSVSWTAMISGYARYGRKSEAGDLFQRVPVRNLFSWTAFISGLVQSGNGVDAFYLFIEMRREGVNIVDPLVLSSIVGASANLAVLELGKQIHGLVITLGYESCIFISNALVDMYAKCSDILAAKEIFGRMQRRDVVSWTSLIVGTAQHGQAKEALAIYDEMIYAGVKPNEVTFVGLIYACSHVGLVSKGRYLFKSMKEDYGINPSLQHYTCFLDLLSRSGQLDEAENLINAMPFKPDEPTWAALLSACKHHNNIDMGIRVADHLLSLEPEDPATYIPLSNIYARAELWEKVSKVRKLMAFMEVKKQPGYSCIELGKESEVFYAGETAHSMKDVIFGLLKKLDAEMRRRGYVPDISSVLHDMEWQEKERQLFWHSERLAVAYGLLKAVPGAVIRVVKNLRVCGDCHAVLKFISTIMKREIVVRDANRYHHFKDGECSCNDFW